MRIHGDFAGRILVFREILSIFEKSIADLRRAVEWDLRKMNLNNQNNENPSS